MEPFWDSFFTILMGLLICGLGGMSLVTIIRGFVPLFQAWRKGLERNQWPSVGGRITGGELVRLDGPKAALSYTYTVYGREYQVEKQVYRDYETIRPREAERILERYAVDDYVEVYYDPEIPANCALERGMKGSLFISLMVPWVVMLLPTILCLVIGFYEFSTLGRK